MVINSKEQGTDLKTLKEQYLWQTNFMKHNHSKPKPDDRECNVTI